MKYLVQENKVKAVSFDYRHEVTQVINKTKAEESGISEEEVEERRDLFGEGAMVTEVPTLSTLFVREIFQPLFIAIIATILIWVAE